VAGITLGVFVIANLAYPDAESDAGFTVMFSAIIGAFVLVGALLASRVRRNRIGPIILWTGALLSSTVAAGTLGTLAAGRPGVPVELLAAAALLNELGFVIPIVVILIGIPLIFPNGTLLSARWGTVAALAASAVVALGLSSLLAPGPIGDSPVINPFAVPELAWFADILDRYVSVAALIGFPAALLSVGIRYRRALELERQQLKWLIATALVASVAFPVSILIPSPVAAGIAFAVGLLALFGLPIAIGIAVLRYRLYDIDRIISRTIAWALISTVLLAAFAILVVGLQAALAGLTQGQTLAVAASTLIAFSLFQPVRRRVQGVVDRRFDRASYDARRTADAFAARMRNQVDLDALTSDLELTVSGAIRPTTAALWVHRRDGAG